METQVGPEVSAAKEAQPLFDRLAIFAAIRSRRAVRSYQAAKVSEADIQTLLEAAVAAPTAMHEEPWVFAVIQDNALLRRISEDVLAGLRAAEPESSSADAWAAAARTDVSTDVFHEAGTVIVIYARPASRFAAGDCWLAAQNLMLAAQGLGLGTCVIGLSVDAFNAPYWKERLGIKFEMTAVAPIVVGIPASPDGALVRKPPNISCWLGR